MTHEQQLLKEVRDGTSWGTLSGSISMGSSGNIDRVGIGGDTFTGSAWIDLITPTNPIVSTSVKDIIGSGFIPFAR